MGRTRRGMLAATGVVLATSGCQVPDRKTTEYTGTDRIYTCSYDSTVFGLESGSDGGTGTVETAWHETGFVGQTRDVLPDRSGDILVTDDRGLHKLAERERGLAHRWTYTDIHGSIRGITADSQNDYYVGSWTAGQGFHKIVERDGHPRRAWVYHRENDTGLITAASDGRGRIALALKNGEVHLIREREGAPELLWRFDTGSGAIVREVLWDGMGGLYVGSEDHHLYKLDAASDERPALQWTYDAGNIIFGASVTPGGDIFVATNDGQVHCLREGDGRRTGDGQTDDVGTDDAEHRTDSDGRPKLQWVYQHTDYDGTAPTDEYFWDGLVHQVATGPSHSDVVYSCSYGENTIHCIATDGAEPVRVWEHNGHRDNVREVRVVGEYAGTTPELW